MPDGGHIGHIFFDLYRFRALFWRLDEIENYIWDLAIFTPNSLFKRSEFPMTNILDLGEFLNIENNCVWVKLGPQKKNCNAEF